MYHNFPKFSDIKRFYHRVMQPEDAAELHCMLIIMNIRMLILSRNGENFVQKMFRISYQTFGLTVSFWYVHGLLL